MYQTQASESTYLLCYRPRHRRHGLGCRALPSAVRSNLKLRFPSVAIAEPESFQGVPVPTSIDGGPSQGTRRAEACGRCSAAWQGVMAGHSLPVNDRQR